MLAAWQEVEGSEDLGTELGQSETDESQRLIFAALEQAAAGARDVGLGSGPNMWKLSKGGRSRARPAATTRGEWGRTVASRWGMMMEGTT